MLFNSHNFSHWRTDSQRSQRYGLVKMKEITKAYLSEKVTHAAVAEPVCKSGNAILDYLANEFSLDFNDTQCQATKDAGTITGLNVLCIINEPTAAAMTYGLSKKKGESQIIVYNLGSDAFNVFHLSINEGVFEVLTTAGNTDLDDEDFNNHDGPLDQELQEEDQY